MNPIASKPPRLASGSLSHLALYLIQQIFGSLLQSSWRFQRIPGLRYILVFVSDIAVFVAQQCQTWPFTTLAFSGWESACSLYLHHCPCSSALPTGRTRLLWPCVFLDPRRQRAYAVESLPSESSHNHPWGSQAFLAQSCALYFPHQPSTCNILLQADSKLHNWTQGLQEASTGEVGSQTTIPSSFWQPQVEPLQGEVKLSLKLAPLDNSHLEERSVARSGFNVDSGLQLALHKSSGNSSQLNFYDLRAHAQDLPVTESSHGKLVQSAIHM